MTNDDDSEAVMPSDLSPAGMQNNTGWKRRITLVLVGCLACIVVIVAVVNYAASTRRGRMVFPPEMFPVAHSHSAPINPALVEYYEKKYGLIDCVIGSRMGALCQDGQVDYKVGDTTCSADGGVKAWIECR
jgi:hypothetical protein